MDNMTIVRSHAIMKRLNYEQVTQIQKKKGRGRMINQEVSLFKLAKKIEKKKIWNDIDSSSLFALQYSWMECPVFVSVINEREKGFLVYRSLEELSSYFDASRQLNVTKDMSSFQILANHSCLALLFVNREELAQKEF